MRESLADIQVRHERDRWKDVVFIGLAVLLTALAIGSVTSKAAGHVSQPQWQLTVTETPDLAK
jgi:hypothetical protein